MKMSITRNLVVLGLTVSSLLANAQQREVNLEIHIDEPANGLVFQSGQTFPLTVSVTNHGPDGLLAGDSLFVILPSGEPTWGTLPDEVPVDSNFVLFSNELTLPVVESTTSIDLCIQLVADPSTEITFGGNSISVSYVDPVPENNVICHTITVEAAPSSISMPDALSDAIEVYPNPTSQVVHIPIHESSNEEIVISIQDISGRTVFRQRLMPEKQANLIQVNVGQLQEGIYIIESQQANRRSTGKLSIVR